METSVKVSAEKKKTVLARYYLLAQLCEQYTADRRSLAALCRLIKQEFRRWKKSAYYPLTDGDVRDISYFIAELKDIAAGLLKGRNVEKHAVAIAHLYDLLDKMRDVLKATEELLHGKKTDTLGTAIETAKTIRDLVGKGVNEIKKTLGGESSK